MRASLSFLLINFRCLRAFDILWKISDGLLHWILIGSSSEFCIYLIWECCDTWVVSWVWINFQMVKVLIAEWSSGDYNELCMYWAVLHSVSRIILVVDASILFSSFSSIWLNFRVLTIVINVLVLFSISCFVISFVYVLSILYYRPSAWWL